jgi:aminopeptidase C
MTAVFFDQKSVNSISCIATFSPPEKFDMIYSDRHTHITNKLSFFPRHIFWALVNKISMELVNN